jgi:myo-inositol-1(or 4)-monophosphatase
LAEKQLLHLVIGGELRDVAHYEFRNLKALDFVGAFPSYREAYAAWQAKAQATVDNALMRYFIIHAHRLLDPEELGEDHEDDGH